MSRSMVKRAILGGGLAALLHAPAAAQGIDALRAEIHALRGDYEARLQAMEARLKVAEAKAEAPKPAMSRGTGAAGNSGSFNPAIGVILDGKFVRARRDSGAYRIGGFAIGDEAGPPQRGFAIGESEMNLSANIDPALFGNLTIAHDGQGEAGVEEAYLQSTALPGGITLRAGRFFSGIGYLNEKHAHTWDFADAPLAYRAFLNTRLSDDGAQVRWLAPTDFFLELGGEALRGANFPAGGSAHRGVGTYALFAHAGTDLNDSSDFRAGLSWLNTAANARETTSEFGTDTFSGDSDTYIADLVFNWAPDGNRAERNLKLQAEYFLRRERGIFNTLPLNQRQSGWYAQAVYQFMPRWRFGLRYDRLYADLPDAAFAGSVLDPNGANPKRASAMIDYGTSEFGRFRLQYNRDQSGPEVDNQAILQYTVSFGAHGAHQY